MVSWKSLSPTVVVLFVAVALASPALAEPDEESGFAIFLGTKMLDKGKWQPVEDQPEFGLQISKESENWPVHFAIDLLFSSDESQLGGITAKGKTREACLGIRKFWGNKRVRPFLGGGIAFVSAEYDVPSIPLLSDDQDSALGYWIGSGVLFRIGEHFDLGFVLRMSRAKLSLYEVGGQGGGEHAGLLVGYAW